MFEQARHFKATASLAAILTTAFFCFGQMSATAAEIDKNQTGFYKDFFDQNIYYEATQFLRFDRLYRKVFNKKKSAGMVNIYDEVPDSDFFTNRHGRKRLSSVDLEKGFAENKSIDLSGKLTVISGKSEGLHPGFFVKDASGHQYLLKFDAAEAPELVTAAEVIASRFYYAIGYHVPEYNIVNFTLDQIAPAADARIIDSTGFSKKLTEEKLQEFMLFIPQDGEGRYRASATRIVEGEKLGYFPFLGIHNGVQNDLVEHEDRRDVRALRVFSSWINNTDVREANTLAMGVTDGSSATQNYLIDFNSALGGSAGGVKPPMFAHEYLIDYGEISKAALSLGFWKKPWQKRWDEVSEQFQGSSTSVGYFDNRYFNPGKFKTQLPYYAFKDLTLADAFWAVKIIMTFTNDDVRAMVKAGRLPGTEDEKQIADTLIERRDIIGKYWFLKANSLDDFNIEGNKLTFKDLAVDYGFAASDQTSYKIETCSLENSKCKNLTASESANPSIDVTSSASATNPVRFAIRIQRAGAKRLSPAVWVDWDGSKIISIKHQD